MNRTKLIELIDNNIRKNENEEITGDIMNNVLKTILDNVPMKGEGGLTNYDPELDYSPGATCIHDNQLYMCYANTTGTFNPGHWQLASAGLVVNSIDERDALISRFRGMVVTVDGDETVRYQLQGGTNNNKWKRIGDQTYKELRLEINEQGQATFEVPGAIIESKLILNNIETSAYEIDNDILFWQTEMFELEPDDELILKYKTN